LDFGAIFDFQNFQKGAFMATFSRKMSFFFDTFRPETLLELTFSEQRLPDILFCFLIAFSLHFGNFWHPFRSMLVHIGTFGSIWLYADPLKPTLLLTTPKKQFLCIRFNSFRCSIVLNCISADVSIDLGIVSQPNFHRLLLSFF
jgi:hypothetical protein